MPKVPDFLLRRLYVKGSLSNLEDGWRFSLRNSLGSGYARQMRPLILDGEHVPMESTSFLKNGKEMTFDAVSEDNTFGLQMNREIEITVHRDPLPPGVHKIEMRFIVPGFGEIGFSFIDQV